VRSRDLVTHHHGGTNNSAHPSLTTTTTATSHCHVPLSRPTQTGPLPTLIKTQAGRARMMVTRPRSATNTVPPKPTQQCKTRTQQCKTQTPRRVRRSTDMMRVQGRARRVEGSRGTQRAGCTRYACHFFVFLYTSTNVLVHPSISNPSHYPRHIERLWVCSTCLECFMPTTTSEHEKRVHLGMFFVFGPIHHLPDTRNVP